MIEIIAYLYAALGSLSLGYFALRVGWPDIRANSSEYKLGLGMIMGLVFIITGIVMSLITATVFPVLSSFSLFLPSVFAISLCAIFLLRFKRSRSSKTVVGVPINYAKFKTGKSLDSVIKQVTGKKTKKAKKVKQVEKIQKNTDLKTKSGLNVFAGLKRESKAVSKGVFSVFSKFFNSVKSPAKPIKTAKHTTKQFIPSMVSQKKQTKKSPKAYVEESAKVNIEELGDLINSEFKKSSDEDVSSSIKPIDVEGLSKKMSEEKLRQEKEEQKKKKKLEKEELDEMAEVILSELKEKKQESKRKTIKDRREERGNKTQMPAQVVNAPVREKDKNKHSRRHGRRGQESKSKLPTEKTISGSSNDFGLGSNVEESSFDDLFSDSDGSVKNNQSSESGEDLFAEELSSDSFESIGSLLTDDVDLESISNESNDSFESQFVEMESLDKKGCPNCGTSGTRVVFCSSCGSAMCSHCADGVDSQDNLVTFTCPKCKERTTVKKLDDN
ncbi:MAG: hypothetical protein KAS30_01155 [Candidatus Diapherotrites archaeon]|nr:hypothetical protein [Candidatus Diapherotrites archaeon]